MGVNKTLIGIKQFLASNKKQKVLVNSRQFFFNFV